MIPAVHGDLLRSIFASICWHGVFKVLAPVVIFVASIFNERTASGNGLVNALRCASSMNRRY